MPRPRFERAAPKLQSALLEAATEEFSAQGYEGASVNRILAAAGLSKGAFYYYFDDKADLAAAVLERETRAFLDGLGSLPSPQSVEEFWSAVWRIAEASLKQLRESKRRGDLFGRLGVAAVRDTDLRSRLGPFFQEARARVGGLWSQGQAVGAVRTDLPLGALLTIIEGMKMAAAGVLLPADRAPTADELEAFTRVHLDLVRRVVEPREEGGRS